MTAPHVQARIDQMTATVSGEIDRQVHAILAVRKRYGRDTASSTVAHVLSEPPYSDANSHLSMLIVALDRLADQAEAES